MNPILLKVIVVFVWTVGAVIGYVMARWSNRVMKQPWTRNDRLMVIALSVLYGPIMPLLVVALVAFFKLATSKWGNEEAKW